MKLDETALAAKAWADLEMAASATGALEVARITLPIEKVRALLNERSALPSSPVSELVERLVNERPVSMLGVLSIHLEAATALTTISTRNADLEREVKRLREALTPFASEADELAVGVADDCVYALPRHPDLGLSDFDVGDLRAASRALSTSPQGGKHE